MTIVILAIVVLVIVVLAVVIRVIPIPVVIAFGPFLFFVPFVVYVYLTELPTLVLSVVFPAKA